MTPDDLVGRAVERQAAAEHGRVAAEAVLPEAVAEHDDRGRARAVVVGAERAADERADAEEREERVARRHSPRSARDRPHPTG